MTSAKVDYSPKHRFSHVRSVTNYLCVLCGRECKPFNRIGFEQNRIEELAQQKLTVREFVHDEGWRDAKCATCDRVFAVHQTCNGAMVRYLREKHGPSAFDYSFGWCPDCEDVD